jgi:phage replication initiation protein
MNNSIRSNECEVKPPNSSTGAINTESLVSLLDWVAFTLPNRERTDKDPSKSDLERVCEIIGIPLNEFVQMSHGKMGYRSQIRCGNIFILSNGTPQMGCHIIMTGQGCRQYENRFGDVWKRLFLLIFNNGGHFARIDAAIDDYNGYISIPEIRQKIEARHILTRFKTARGLIEYDLSAEPDTNKGETIYFGSSMSRIKIRFYDKAKEQRVDYLWNRAEIECHNERADIVAELILSDRPLGEIVAGVLRNYLNFVEPNEDSNKARWPVSKWWLDFLGNVEKLRLTIKKGAKTIEDVKGWLDRQVSTSLALLHKHYKDSYDFVGDLIEKGNSRLKPHHYAMLQG